MSRNLFLRSALSLASVRSVHSDAVSKIEIKSIEEKINFPSAISYLMSAKLLSRIIRVEADGLPKRFLPFINKNGDINIENKIYVSCERPLLMHYASRDEAPYAATPEVLTNFYEIPIGKITEINMPVGLPFKFAPQADQSQFFIVVSGELKLVPTYQQLLNGYYLKVVKDFSGGRDLHQEGDAKIIASSHSVVPKVGFRIVTGISPFKIEMNFCNLQENPEKRSDCGIIRDLPAMCVIDFYPEENGMRYKFSGEAHITDTNDISVLYNRSRPNFSSKNNEQDWNIALREDLSPIKTQENLR